MTSALQRDLFEVPTPLDVAKTLPEWFAAWDLSEALGYKTCGDPEFKYLFFDLEWLYLEERRIYSGSGPHGGPDYRGYRSLYRIKATMNCPCCGLDVVESPGPRVWHDIRGEHPANVICTHCASSLPVTESFRIGTTCSQEVQL